MKFNSILMNVTKSLNGIALGGKRNDPELKAIDRGVLQVAMMLAALDGEILPAEYAAFEELSKKCRGANAKNVRECLDGALRKGGYLMAMAQIGVYSEKERLNAFVEMAKDALPRGFEAGSMADLRRAFALWVAMGVSDGEFSAIERKAIDSLASSVATVKVWSKGNRERRLALLEDDFFVKAEKIVRNLGVDSRRAKAEEELEQLVGSVEVATKKGVARQPAAKIGVRIAVMALISCAAAPLMAAGSPASEDVNGPDGMIHRRAFRGGDSSMTMHAENLGDTAVGQWSVGFTF